MDEATKSVHEGVLKKCCTDPAPAIGWAQAPLFESVLESRHLFSMGDFDLLAGQGNLGWIVAKIFEPWRATISFGPPLAG